MSLQKIRSAKNITYTDRYSKNPIINTLIKNKLQTQMVLVKENFAKIIKKQQEQKPIKSTSRLAIKRNKSYSINPKMIQEAIEYNPISKINKNIQQFISHRQNDSFLLSQAQISEINRAREQHSGLTTKLFKTDYINYEAPLDYHKFSQTVKLGSIQDHSEQVWLPNKPEIEYLIHDRKQQIDTQYIRERGKSKQQIIQKQLQNFTNRITGNTVGFSRQQLFNFPLISFKGGISTQNLKPAQYTPQKYHKNDYKLIQKWLDLSLEQIRLQTKEPHLKLNMIYSCYMCVWKQLIRLTYIQSQQKGLTLEKMFYSMLKLFWGLITQQQDLSRVFQRENQTQLKSLNKLMEKRLEQLNRNLTFQSKQLQKVKQVNHKLSKVFISYEKVNHQITEQLQKQQKQKKQIEKQFDSLNHSYFKTLQLLYDNKLIQMQFNAEESKQLKSTKKFHTNISYKTFFIFDQHSKPKILGRFKYENKVPNPNPRYADLGVEQTFSEQLKKYQQRYGHKIKEIQNQINRFWDKKQDDLQMKGIIDSLILEVRIKDQGVGTTQFQKTQFQCQFPENSEYYVQKLLKQQRQQMNIKFNQQKKQYQNQIQQKELSLLKWKQNSQQMQQKYKNLQDSMQKLNQVIKKLKQNNIQLLQQIQKIAKQKQQERKQVEKLRIEFQNSQNMEQQAILSKQKFQRQRNLMSIQVEKQKENNKYLVRANLQLKEKAQKFDIRYSTLLKSVKNVAPWLQKFINNVDKPLEQIDLNLFKAVSNNIEQHLSDYVTKDSSLFMTRLT